MSYSQKMSGGNPSADDIALTAENEESLKVLIRKL